MSTSLRAAAETLRTPSRGAPASFLKHAGEVAQYFGFQHAREFSPERSYTFAKVAGAASESRSADPHLLYYASGSPMHIPGDLRLGKQNDLAEFGLVIAGPEESLAEVILMRTLVTILTEWGLPGVRVRVNAMGDRDSKARFGRELSGYLRKHFETLDEECRNNATHDPAKVYHCRSEACRAIVASGPRAMNFLSEKSRLHFREVLEHIEELNIPYELDDMLPGDERESRVSFAIDTGGSPLIVGAAGGRFDDHMKKQSGKPLCAAHIYFRKGSLNAAHFMPTKKSAAPRLFFIQLGVRAKIQGLTVVDMVRRAGIPMRQTFDARSLAPQIEAAKVAGTPHLIIMGAREALDGTVIIRALDNSTQQIVALRDLPRALKSLR